MKLTIVILVVLGLVAAMCTVMLVNFLPGMMGGEKTEKNEIPVLVANRSITAHTELTKDDLEESKIDLAKVPAGHYSDPTTYLSDKINAVGKTLASEMTAGQALTWDMIITDPDRATILKALKPGMRAYPIRLSGDQIVGGLLEPGCFVDVLTMFSTRSTKGEAVSMTVLENIKVIAVKGELGGGSNPDQEGKTSGGSKKSAGGGWTVTLLVNTSQAEMLQLATGKGKMALTLRNPLDDIEVDKRGTAFDSRKIGAQSDFFNTETSSQKGPSQTPSTKNRVPKSPKHHVEVYRGNKLSYAEVEASKAQQ